MTMGHTILAGLNRRNREFWSVQQLSLEHRMADAAIRETAFDIMNAEQKRLPIYYQTSIYEALETGERAKRRCLSQQARKGGSAEKTDALQRLIEQFVEHNPHGTEPQLRSKLREHQAIDPIQDVNDEVVFFTTSDGRTKTAMLSGLKHRLTRARKRALKEKKSR